MKNLTFRALLAVTVALLVVSCARPAANNPRARGGGARGAIPAEAIPTAVARITTVRPSVTIAGIIAPLQNVAISSALAEPATEVDVNEGDHVRRGQTLAVLRTTDLAANLQAQLRTAASDDAKTLQTKYTAQLNFGQNPNAVAQARAALAQARQTLAQDRLTLKRDDELVTNGYLAQQNYDQQRTQVLNDEAAVRSAQAALASAITNQNVNGTPQQGLQAANVASAAAEAAAARAQADQIRAQIALATIVSPVDGIVVNRNLNPGEYPNGRTLFVVQELSRVYAELNASSSDVFRIKSGAPVQLQAGGDQSARAFNGRVVAVLGQVQPGSTNFTVKVLVANPQEALQAGVPVTARILLPATSGVGIPTTSFLDDTRSSVMIARRGVANVAKVSEVADDGTTSIVRGLPAGARVIADGQLGLTPGQPLGGGPRGSPPPGGRRRPRAES
ncbi:MAG: efflux RND transporter periplasmic adaptor subunit [Candidatus Eremiobacteraeota bacterium]|nr:efflux RND transporter periplasmic adaptor subunit [Candidatus Eremiobacteraeota bacterium]MBV8354601.1 efflux RND transporter periplasmic adaptor subunit [Candidatus Eremiobacteraeota bacterium]